MMPLFRIDKEPALTVTVPGVPVLPGSARDTMPGCGPEVPSIDRSPETLSKRLPAFPDAKVLPEITPPPAMLNDPAVTETSPAFPTPDATVPREAPESTVIGPSTLTSTAPLTPEPEVRASRPVPLCNVSCPATMLIEPPLAAPE